MLKWVLHDTLGPSALFMTCAGWAGLAALVVALAHLAGVFERFGEHDEEAELAVTVSGTE